MLFNKCILSHSCISVILPPLTFRAHTQRNELHLPFSKTKSLFFSALIAIKPAQWALLRVQRYTLLMNYTTFYTQFLTIDNVFYDFITFLQVTRRYFLISFNIALASASPSAAFLRIFSSTSSPFLGLVTDLTRNILAFFSSAATPFPFR